MDNMKYYNDSLAYDFEMFMPRPVKREEDNIVKMPQRSPKVRARQQRAVRRMSVSAFAVMVTIVALAALFGNITLRLRINELNSSINRVKSEINALDSEQTALEVEYGRRISYANVELEATQLGMCKRSKDQVKYIRINEKDVAKTADGKILSSEK